MHNSVPLLNPAQAARRLGVSAKALRIYERGGLLQPRRNAAILYCPPNHSPPVLVAPLPGAPGYESVASCLASPEMRRRSAGGTMVVTPPA